VFFRRTMAPGAAIITGAASGLGREMAVLLRRAGWHTALVDLPQALDGADEVAGGFGPPPRIAGFDVRDAVAWRALHDSLRAEWPTLDLLVNCAGVGATGEVGTLPEVQWRRVLDTNLLGLAPPSMAAYSASKAGVVALSEAIAAECPRGRPGVTVVCAGFFRSGLLDTWHFTGGVEAREARRRMDASRWDSRRVAGRVLRAVHANRRYVVVGTQARWLWRLKRLAPRTTTALVRGIYRRLHR